MDNQVNIICDKTFGGNGGDWAYSLIQTSDSGYAVAGRTSSKGARKYDAWILKLGKSGNIGKVLEEKP